MRKDLEATVLSSFLSFSFALVSPPLNYCDNVENDNACTRYSFSLCDSFHFLRFSFAFKSWIK